MADRGARIEDGSVRPSWSILYLLCALLVLSAPPARAQAPDSAQAAPQAPPQAPPVGFAHADPGIAVADTLPARLPELDVPALLDALPGAFVYEFGTLGWPDAWSRDALPPHRTALTLDGLPFDDPATGRPRYDLLPTAWLEPPVVGAGRHGAPVAVATRLRPYAPRRPLTEIAYRSGSGIQSVMATHVQRRPRRLFGQDGVLGLLGGYGGHAAQGEYDGSRLRRGRQLLGRLRYAQPRGAVELRVLHNRRSLGAHGGVLPVPGFSFESIYARLVAPVANPNARRQTIRNDFAATVRARLLPARAEPLTVSAFFTKEFFEYRLPGDTLSARARRAGVHAEQALRLGAHHLRLRADAWRDEITRSNALPDSLGLRRTQLH
ncbi:MAG: hypothetical protein R3247_14810, partial [Rhodothermales bacterium]|nr:hypothetical protein [Rhodothermales bacterium]